MIGCTPNFNPTCVCVCLVVCACVCERVCVRVCMSMCVCVRFASSVKISEPTGYIMMKLDVDILEIESNGL